MQSFVYKNARYTRYSYIVYKATVITNYFPKTSQRTQIFGRANGRQGRRERCVSRKRARVRREKRRGTACFPDPCCSPESLSSSADAATALRAPAAAPRQTAVPRARERRERCSPLDAASALLESRVPLWTRAAGAKRALSGPTGHFERRSDE